MVLQNLVTGRVQQFDEIVAAENSDSPEILWRPKQANSGPNVFEVERSSIPVAENRSAGAKLKLEFRIDLRSPVKEREPDHEAVRNFVAAGECDVIGVKAGNASAKRELRDLWLILEDLLGPEAFVLKSGCFVCGEGHSIGRYHSAGGRSLTFKKARSFDSWIGLSVGRPKRQQDSPYYQDTANWRSHV